MKIERKDKNTKKAREKWIKTIFNEIYVHIGKSKPISNFVRAFHLPAHYVAHFPASPRKGKVDSLQLLLIKSVPRNEIVIKILVERPLRGSFPPDSVNFNKNRWCSKKCSAWAKSMVKRVGPGAEELEKCVKLYCKTIARQVAQNRGRYS